FDDGLLAIAEGAVPEYVAQYRKACKGGVRVHFRQESAFPEIEVRKCTLTPAFRRWSQFLGFGHLGATHQPRDAAQIGETDPQPVEHAVLGDAAGARAMPDRDADALESCALYQRGQI